ncbi:MAG: hypothetical protein NPIRA02_30640 [Nitrospirales bacterium]|nr:MAG: hypothetical protein NPIRA02_30640 [Nitrospirales bacterium]
MPIITKDPTIRDDDALRFETYRNYLFRISELIRDTHTNWGNFAVACVDATRSLRPIHEPDLKYLRRFLGIAWNTESLIQEQPTDIELIRINNAWLPVQAYYSIYAASETIAYAVDGAYAGSHQKALRKATDFLVKLPIKPWNLAYSGTCGRDQRQHQPKNFPFGTVPAHNLSGTSASHLNVIATCLKAEHYNRIDAEYKRSKKFKYQYDPGYTGLLHFLYRLRILSNYRGVELFIVEGSDDDIRSFSDSLRWIVEWTLTYFEIVLLRKFRRRVITDLAKDFLSRNPRAYKLEERIDGYQKLY